MLRILVGNKNDLNEHREISQDLAVNFAMLENIDIAIETSAKNDENINYLFYTVAEKLVNGVEYESFRQEHPYSTSKDMLKYSSTSKSMEKLFQSPRSHSSFYLSRKTTFKKNVFQKFCVIIWKGKNSLKRIFWLKSKNKALSDLIEQICFEEADVGHFQT